MTGVDHWVVIIGLSYVANVSEKRRVEFSGIKFLKFGINLINDIKLNYALRETCKCFTLNETRKKEKK